MASKSGVTRRGFITMAAAGVANSGLAKTVLPGAPAQDGSGSGRLASPIRPAWQAFHLEKGRHLFVDDYLVAGSENLKTTLHHPRKMDKPILFGIGSADNNAQPYATVLYDEQRGRFRMWYGSRRNWNNIEAFGILAYVESADGIHWEKPYKEVFQTNGYAFGVTDGGPEEPDPSRRYKLTYWEEGSLNSTICDGHTGVGVAFSPDGLNWTKYQPHPLPSLPDLMKDSVRCDPQKIGNIKFRDCAMDCMFSTWDPIRKIHVAYVKTWSWPPDEFGYISPTAIGLGQRLESVTTSPDFIHWSTPVRCFVPEPGDVRSIEFGYIFRAKPRGNQMLITSCILDQGISTAKGNGVGYTVLSTTSDLFHCNRMREPWLDRVAEDSQAVDHAMAWVAEMITVGDEEYIYYAGYEWGHKNFTDRTMNLARLRKDGFVSRDAGHEWGKLVTPLVRCDAGQMVVNANIRGDLRLRILDKDGRPIAGFGEGDVGVVKGDSTAHRMQGKASLAELKGQPVQFEFSLRDAELYAFELS